MLRGCSTGPSGPTAAFTGFGRYLGRPLADLSTFLNPQAVVVDGMLGAAGAPVRAGLREALDRYCAPDVARAVRVVPGGLGARAAFAGASALAMEHGVFTRD